MLGAAPLLAEAGIYRFDWQGGAGYRLEGAIAFDPDRALGIVTAADVTCFEIFGFHEEKPLGYWHLGLLTEETAWRLHFLPADQRFLDEGDGIWMPQAWNMEGDGYGCGPGGLGFNLGNVAQDICVDAQLIEQSQVSPFQTFPAEPAPDHRFSSGACMGPLLLGALRP